MYVKKTKPTRRSPNRVCMGWSFLEPDDCITKENVRACRWQRLEVPIIQADFAAPWYPTVARCVSLSK